MILGCALFLTSLVGILSGAEPWRRHCDGSASTDRLRSASSALGGAAAWRSRSRTRCRPQPPGSRSAAPGCSCAIWSKGDTHPVGERSTSVRWTSAKVAMGSRLSDSTSATVPSSALTWPLATADDLWPQVSAPGPRSGVPDGSVGEELGDQGDAPDEIASVVVRAVVETGSELPDVIGENVAQRLAAPWGVESEVDVEVEFEVGVD